MSGEADDHEEYDSAYPLRCLHRVARNGIEVRCGHCRGCRGLKFMEDVRIGVDGLSRPGRFVFMALMAPEPIDVTNIHMAPPKRYADGWNRDICDRLHSTPCLCGRWHVPGYALTWFRIPYRWSTPDGPEVFRRRAERNLLTARLVNATLSKLRRRYPGVEVYYALDLTNLLSVRAQWLLRFPADTCVDCDALVAWLADTRLRGFDMGWDPVHHDCRVLKPADILAEQFMAHMVHATFLGTGCNDTGVDDEAIRDIYRKYGAESETDGRGEWFQVSDTDRYGRQQELDALQKDRDHLNRYRHRMLHELTRSSLLNEVIPDQSCPVHGEFGYAYDTVDYGVGMWRPGLAYVDRWEKMTYDAAGGADFADLLTCVGMLRRNRECTCKSNPLFIKRDDIANYGLGEHLTGYTRGWSSLNKTILKAQRINHVLNRDNDTENDALKLNDLLHWLKTVD
ncbi:hypothetical protein D2E25_1823 [Bifidobacterium goeldii]|uniref:Uncharacterized protein n=2 Tax=Bifidobacterium goeldii TaxID=2306975 RepID=A0A430FEW0_9BIFI|nr:hypothetical protein D2E25_1823 [Bifidobacterium goeldii]